MLKLVIHLGKLVIAKNHELSRLKLQLLHLFDGTGSSTQAVIRECKSGKEAYRVKKAPIGD